MIGGLTVAAVFLLARFLRSSQKLIEADGPPGD